MAKLWVTVWEHAGEVALGDPIQIMTPVTMSGTAAATEAVSGSGRKRRRCRLFADGDCHVRWGDGVTATTNDTPMGAENPEYLDIESGHVISVIERV